MEEILINRLSKFIEEIKSMSAQALNLSNNLSNDNLEQARVLSAKLKTILARFESELHNYFNICKNPDADEISNFTTYQLQGIEMLAELDIKLKLIYEPCTVTPKETSSYSKLPDLNLPQFEGELLEWCSFWDQFNSSINRRNLNEVDKLLYLKSSVKGNALRLIEGLTTTNKNYNIAVNILKARYGKEDEVIHAHHRAINKVKQAENFEDCRTTLDEIQRHLTVLQSMGENIDTNQMRFMVMEKFPADLIYDTKMKLGSDSTLTMEGILKHLSLIISTKEDAIRITQQPCNSDAVEVSYTTENLHVKDTTNLRRPWPGKKNFPNNTKLFQRHAQERKPIKKRLFGERVNHVSEKRKKLWNCIFCNGNHFNADCNIKTLDERREKLKNRCFICFKQGHVKAQCEGKRKCKFCGKHGVHNQALCPSKFPRKAKQDKEFSSGLHISSSTPTILQTAIAKVQGQGNIRKSCRILLDTGSGRSYITEAMAKELNLQAEEQNNLAIFTFGSQKPREIQSSLVKLRIMTVNNTIRTIFTNVVPIISQGVTYPNEKLLGWRNDENYQLADDGSLLDRIDILIGNDYYYSIMSSDKIQIDQDLYLVMSEFGWIISGRVPINKSMEQLSVLTYFQTSSELGFHQLDPPLDNGDVKCLWDLETIGITDSPKANRDEEAIKHFNETTEFKDQRYYVSWPWSESPIGLPSNFGLAYGRLKGLFKRLDKDSLIAYDETIKDQLNKGVIETFPEGRVNHAVHYIPHHGVSSPGKALRIVYDGSAHVKDSKSLNQYLYCGPLLLEDLTGLLIKFRCYAIGITADVQKAFLQIALKEVDRDVTRFLWLKDFHRPPTDDNLVQLRFTRVPFGLTSSPFILNATIKHHLSCSKNKSVKRAANDIYVDNLVTGTSSLKETLELYKNLKKTFEEISMNLRDWSSNSKCFMKSIPDSNSDKIVKVLGLNWNVKDDELTLRVRINENNKYTKRGVLKTIAAVYDPCGFSVPVMLTAKILFQDLWKTKVKWDNLLDEETINRWKTILKDIKDIETIRIPRRTIVLNEGIAELHCFTDSAMQAYAAVVYLVRGREIQFLIGKSRLVPIKDQQNLRIPRLELLGVLIGSRLIKYVLRFLPVKVNRQILWTDSQIVIDWYKSNKLLTPFVTRRVEEIKQNRDLIIRHVPSDQNPADGGTRPNASKEDRTRWLLGPEFLKKEQIEWPIGPSNTINLLARESLPNAEIIDSAQTNKEHDEEIAEEMNEQLQEVPKRLLDEREPKDNVLKEVKKLQAKHFRDEVNGKETSISRNLGLFKDIDGILRCRGRLKYAEWSFDKRYPVIIPKDCEFTNKLIIDTHEMNYHVGVNHTLSLIRQNYWIPQGKSQVKKVLSKCPQCVKHGGGPYKLPSTPALPPERVNYMKPYTFTGIDYLGPIFVKTKKGTEKRWICLLTCLTVRAVHLEVVEDLSAEEGLLALRRMISTRGIPTLITSDNASHFKLISDIVANSYCVENKIKWRFIPELAPWHGGFYERLVGLVKHCLRRTLQKHLLGDSQLATVVKEIEAVLNSRPLISVDSELEHILKPSDFLQPGICVTLKTAENDASLQGTSTKTNLIMSWKKTRLILDEFKEMFQNRYLPSLRERYSHQPKQPRVMSHFEPREGQIVQIKGDKNREGWKVGRIISIPKGSDGLIRVAQVKVGDKIFTRSIAHLYPLEIEDNERPRTEFQETTRKLQPVQLNGDPPKDGEFSPSAITETEPLQKETLADQEVRQLVDMEMTDDTMVENDCKETEIEIDSTDRENNELRDHVKNAMCNDTLTDGLDHKRAAAVRALEKIREWTQNLLTTLL